MKKVLIADDEEGIRSLVRLTLGRESETLEASTGTEALEVARERVPDLILLDISMPDLTGIEVCRVLKSDGRTSSIPVVMLTARAEEADRVAAEEAGADGYITKPFSPLELLRTVEEMMLAPPDGGPG